MQRYLTVILLVFLTQSILGQTVFGKWKTYDIFDRNVEESIVEIYNVDNRLFIKIDQILPLKHRYDVCNKCTDQRKNQPILGMVILKGAIFENDVWKGAQILNPKNGKEYSCHISLESADILKVRGFIGYPIFGKTVFWTRIK